MRGPPASAAAVLLPAAPAAPPAVLLPVPPAVLAAVVPEAAVADVLLPPEQAVSIMVAASASASGLKCFLMVTLLSFYGTCPVSLVHIFRDRFAALRLHLPAALSLS